MDRNIRKVIVVGFSDPNDIDIIYKEWCKHYGSYVAIDQFRFLCRENPTGVTVDFLDRKIIHMTRCLMAVIEGHHFSFIL